jgi:hypothetical protein
MKTPVLTLFMAITYWIGIYVTTTIPQFVDDYHVNLLWLTIVIPNLVRFIIGNVPRLAVDRSFFLTSSIIALVIVYLINARWDKFRPAIKGTETNLRRKLEMNALLIASFVTGALLTYFTGIDNSIYSNMGWSNS